MKRGKARRVRERTGRIDRVASLGRSKRESRWPKRAAIYAARRKSKARTEAPRRSRVDEGRKRVGERQREREREVYARETFFESRGENESNERPRRTSAARARSRAMVDKGSPRVALRWAAGGWVGEGEEEERSRGRYYRRLSEIDMPRRGMKARRGGRRRGMSGAERERQIDGTDAAHGAKWRKREAAIYALRGSRCRRGRELAPPDEERRAKGED